MAEWPTDTDYLALWPLLVERLSDPDLVADARDVQLIYDLADILLQQTGVTDRCVYVKYNGDEIVESVGRGRHQLIRQRWEIAIASRYVRVPRGKRWKGDPAGRLMAQVLRALSGWHPPEIPGDAAFQRISAPAPSFELGGGWGIFFLAFAIHVPTEGA